MIFFPVTTPIARREQLYNLF